MNFINDLRKNYKGYLFIAILTLFYAMVFVFIHEIGHILAVYLVDCGGEISEFVLFPSRYVSYTFDRNLMTNNDILPHFKWGFLYLTP